MSVNVGYLFGIMVTQREDIYVNLSLANGIDKAMLVINATAPFAVCSFQKFGLANTSKRVLQDVFK